LCGSAAAIFETEGLDVEFALAESEVVRDCWLPPFAWERTSEQGCTEYSNGKCELSSLLLLMEAYEKLLDCWVLMLTNKMLRDGLLSCLLFKGNGFGCLDRLVTAGADVDNDARRAVEIPLCALTRQEQREECHIIAPSSPPAPLTFPFPY
jgi:hypothetical protein